MNRSALSLGRTVLFWSSSSVFGLGTSGISNEAAVSAAALGAFNTVTAQADDPTAVYFNPAGLVQLKGLAVSINLNTVSAEVEHESPSGATTESETGLIHVP